MPYDKDGKYYRKPVFNENFKYNLDRKKNNNKNSKIIYAITSSPSNRDIRDHDIWYWWHRLTYRNTLRQTYKGINFYAKIL